MGEVKTTRTEGDVLGWLQGSVDVALIHLSVILDLHDLDWRTRVRLTELRRQLQDDLGVTRSDLDAIINRKEARHDDHT